jgi:hypothetical protein
MYLVCWNLIVGESFVFVMFGSMECVDWVAQWFGSVCLLPDTLHSLLDWFLAPLKKRKSWRRGILMI